MSKHEENPIKLFDNWYKQAQNSDIEEPNAVNIATSTKDGKPSNRMVLMKHFDDNGFVFYTNLESKKGKQIEENPYVSMCFFWPLINKQVRIEGEVLKVSDKEADEYFDSRPINSRIGATISKQSQEIKESDFNLFKNSTIEAFKKLASKEIKRPDYWSGFCLKPNLIEFWQRGDFRIHKRILYKRKADSWEISFIYP
jgi:pyridoxamine 5'-phosphate oxidase